ncbi:MAG TPA: hypothetical protein VFL91_08405 [Thermomicrobiales bacterium]|nr:hypothetical protein [Thermomicrobiales bacterium]
MFWRVRFAVRYWRRRTSERVLLGAARRMPRQLRYWATVVAIAEATSGRYGSTVVPELRAVDVLARIEH